MVQAERPTRQVRKGQGNAKRPKVSELLNRALASAWTRAVMSQWWIPPGKVGHEPPYPRSRPARRMAPSSLCQPARAQCPRAVDRRLAF